MESEMRPWGKFTVLYETELYKVKELSLNPGGSLSLQSHEKREEFWTVARGSGSVTVGERVFQASPGGSFKIPKGARHRAEAGENGLVIVEVQLGEAFDEDDIVRYEDKYNRACGA